MQKTVELPYIPLDEFMERYEAFAKDNFVLQSLHKHKKGFTWEQLPKHLIQDLFKKLGAKPSIQKY